jgi:hypothetical protein
MNLKKVSPTAAIMLSAILVTFTCLSCGTYPAEKFEGLQKAKVPIYLPELEPTTSTQDYKVALNLGVAASDALASIFKEDPAASRRYMGMIHDYAKKLGLPETFLGQLGTINAALEQGDWSKVGKLSSHFGEQLLDELEKVGKKNDAILAYAAFTLEGPYITAKSVDNRFSPESAKLLRDVDLVYLEKTLKALSANFKGKKEVEAITVALPQINQIVSQPENYTYTQADVKNLISICEPLRQVLLSD